MVVCSLLAEGLLVEAKGGSGGGRGGGALLGPDCVAVGGGEGGADLSGGQAGHVRHCLAHLLGLCTALLAIHCLTHLLQGAGALKQKVK